MKGLVNTTHAANLLGFTSAAELLDALRRDGMQQAGFLEFVEERDVRRLGMKLIAVSRDPERKARLREAVAKLRAEVET
jgi:hypothetical protein